MKSDSQIKLLLSPGKRLLLLLCFFVVCYVLLSLLALMMMRIFGEDSTPAMRILTVLQDIVVFIVPAIGTAMIVTRQPADLLTVDRVPSLRVTLLGVIVLVVSIPAINSLIAANEALPLPPEIADRLRAMEQNAAGMVETVTGPHTIPNLLMTILIVGVMAGFSEELLFRGCLQRLLSCGGMNHHAAIWVAAAVFSLLHLQFYGFFPRLVLGAFFGYLLWWTGSIWVPVIIHTFNNTSYLIEQYRTYGMAETPQIGADGNLSVVSVSILLTAVGIYMIHKITHTNADKQIS